MTLRCAAVFAALFLFSGGAPVHAQDVTLTSRDGQIELSGTLLGFDGEFYRLRTLYGELTVDGSGVICDGPGCPNLQAYVAKLAISGSSTMGAVLMPALVEGFARRGGYQTKRIDVDATHFQIELTDSQTGRQAAILSFRVTNSDEGFADLLADEADIVMSLREIRGSELKRAAEAGMGDLSAANRSRVVALDAIVPVVSPRNPVQRMSPLALARAYAGQITNWSELGGADAPITLHAPDANTGLGQATVDQILKPVDLQMTQGVVRHATGAALAAAVMDDPFALGVASYAEVDRMQPLTLAGSCGRALRATRRTIKTEDYPMTAPMFLYTPARRLPAIAREFLVYTHGVSAQAVIRRSGFVDQAAEEIPIDDQGNRFANAITAAGSEVPLAELQRMAGVLQDLKRLTTSFRFEAGSARLDAQSRSNVVQLAQRLEQGIYDARRIVFVGFSDGEGSADANRNIAAQRAEAVRTAVIQAAETADLGQVVIDVAAFGEALPMACDDTAWGRQTNRRVEVWVR